MINGRNDGAITRLFAIEGVATKLPHIRAKSHTTGSSTRRNKTIRPTTTKGTGNELRTSPAKYSKFPSLVADCLRRKTPIT